MNLIAEVDIPGSPESVKSFIININILLYIINKIRDSRMIKDIDNIKKFLVAITEDLKSLDSRIADLESTCETIEIELAKSPSIITYSLDDKSGCLIEDEINELFSLLDSVDGYE